MSAPAPAYVVAVLSGGELTRLVFGCAAPAAQTCGLLRRMRAWTAGPPPTVELRRYPAGPPPREAAEVARAEALLTLLYAPPGGEA